MSKMVRISQETEQKIDHLQSVLSLNKQAIVKKAVDHLDKEVLFTQMDYAYRRMKKDKKAWEEECAEREEWFALDKEIKHE